MSTALYLNTARFGLLLPRVQRLYCDFLKFRVDEVSSLYFDEFISLGFECLPNKIQIKYPFLSDWKGLKNLKQSLSKLVVDPLYSTKNTKILLANRSFQLMKLGAHLLFLKSKRILTTDVEWPAYRAILEQQKDRKGSKIETVYLREAILQDNCSLEELISIIVSSYHKYECDGLFISHITFEGFRLPVEDIVKTITSQNKRPSFVVVDGSQSFCHSPLNLELGYSDFYITGCHKWLRAWHPMGLGFCYQSNSVEFITNVYHQMLENGELDDPLLYFTNQLELGSHAEFTETVNLNPLFSAAAAVSILNSHQLIEQKFNELVDQVDKLKTISESLNWSPLVKNDFIKSGIGLIKSNKSSVRVLTVKQLEATFKLYGVALTAYKKGIIRVSAPIRSLNKDDYQIFHKSLDSVY